MSLVLTREAVAASRSQASALVGVGLLLWLVVTVAFRLVGHVLLPPGYPGRIAIVFVVTVPAMAMLSFAVYSLLDVPPGRRLTAATLLVFPGLVLDSVVLTTFEMVFPAMAPSVRSTFGGLVLLAYAAVLLTGLIPLQYIDEAATDDAGTDAGRAVDRPTEPAGVDAPSEN
jgi:hypothetical protein